MKTRLTLKPGQNGTKKLMEKYGDRLLAVRYRYDPGRKLRLKTVELVEDAMLWDPLRPQDLNPSSWVLVRIGIEEQELRESVKVAGGRWQPDRKLWQLTFYDAQALGLTARIVCAV